MELRGNVVAAYYRDAKNTIFGISVSYPAYASFYGGTVPIILDMTTQQILDFFRVDELSKIVGKEVYIQPRKTGRGYDSVHRSAPKLIRCGGEDDRDNS
jgi:hypothetical protein